MVPNIDIQDLRSRVKSMYRQVAENPGGEFHFEMGRTLAERLGYSGENLDNIPAEAIDSFAGVGYAFDLADLQGGESVLDLGSGSGMDAFFAAREVGLRGHVTGLDMTDAQLRKAESLSQRHSVKNISFVKGYIEELPLGDASFDVVMSNGVINLSAEKDNVFGEIARVLKPGGRMAVADIVTEQQLTQEIVRDTSLWAACIGGAAQEDLYRSLIEAAGLRVRSVKENAAYQFLSKSARGASEQFGVKSISLLAEKDGNG